MHSLRQGTTLSKPSPAAPVYGVPDEKVERVIRLDAVKRYINYLNMDIERPTLNYLQRLIQQHLIRIPYETFSKFYYFSKGDSFVPSLSTFAENLHLKGWEGHASR